MMRIFLLISFILFFGVGRLYAQCAMCRATLENNISNGDPGIATGINLGILYLFFAPYLAVGAIAFFWYKTSKSNTRNDLSKSALHG